MVIAICLLSACGSPGGAPVVTRNHAPQKQLGYAGRYTVKPGDTLYAIAWRAGVDYRKIAEWNRIQYPYTIYAGQRLYLRSAAKKGSTNFKNGKFANKQKAPTTSQKSKKALIKPSRLQPSAAKGNRPPASFEAARRLKWQWPTIGTVTQRFSKRDPTKKGLKISGRAGQSVRAAEAGQVVYSGSGLIGYGPLIIIKHDKNYLSAYGHNRKLLVAEGDVVAKGERVAEMGHAANGKTLLHFEIRRRGKPVDPTVLLPKQ
ncbi:peptidoglycan DD-metalloendopeptidase family protein [Pseudomonadota bacterium]